MQLTHFEEIYAQRCRLQRRSFYQFSLFIKMHKVENPALDNHAFKPVDIFKCRQKWTEKRNTTWVRSHCTALNSSMLKQPTKMFSKILKRPHFTEWERHDSLQSDSQWKPHDDRVRCTAPWCNWQRVMRQWKIKHVEARRSWDDVGLNCIQGCLLVLILAANHVTHLKSFAFVIRKTSHTTIWLFLLAPGTLP